MATMRNPVLLVMIALLPLRMWAAEAMVQQMAQAQVVAAAATAASGGVEAMEDMPDDCPMTVHARSGARADDGGSPAPQPHCMACHLSIVSPSHTLAAADAGPAPTGPPPAPSSQFASADTRRHQKPPIS
jgi:hypothetical protein